MSLRERTRFGLASHLDQKNERASGEAKGGGGLGVLIVLWHRTHSENAAAILGHGSRETACPYGLDNNGTGVCFSDELLTPNEGENGDTVLRVTLDCTPEEIRQFEWIEEGKGFRKFLIPASFIVAYGSVARVRKDSLGMRKNRRSATMTRR